MLQWTGTRPIQLTINAPLLLPTATAAEKKLGLDLSAEATTTPARAVEVAP